MHYINDSFLLACKANLMLTLLNHLPHLRHSQVTFGVMSR